ncbi:zinc finger MYM-type protein 1-like [Sorghum bicolor]|uniref:zinc finger MYM-type protein 1-like n=1 Tax=Sorghum bicolor TaxID=4558 RepID=UPI000B423896|nr:zinc finger MYM-type protein 1-like [Sorghum bicolor]|eukprot:XP_021303825.1 zinc finger MYM-type protein 1-like [Sorghum bicolor]
MPAAQHNRSIAVQLDSPNSPAASSPEDTCPHRLYLYEYTTFSRWLLQRFICLLKSFRSNLLASSQTVADRLRPPTNMVNFDELPYDPADRRKISDYIGEKLQNEIRRKYLITGPFRPPLGFKYPQKIIAGVPRRFQAEWFTKYDWLEYSEKVYKCFYLYCYLFRDSNEGQGGNDAFAKDGWDGFNKSDRLQDHVGIRPNSFHNTTVKRCNNLMKPDQSIVNALNKQKDITIEEYRKRLNTSIDATRFLLHQGLAFRGHDELEESKNKGNFLELVDLLEKQNDSKEQMAVVLRYVDKSGSIKERLIGLVHVSETSASCLKSNIDSLFGKYGLSIKQIRGQGYDGASNMRGEFNGLRALILRENSSAYYIHCFAHQLQLVIVAVAKKNDDIGDFFDMVSLLINVARASCKRKDMIRESQQERVAKEIGGGQLSTGTELNQEQSLARAGDTHWSSHYKTLKRISSLFTDVSEVLQYVEKEGPTDAKKRQARGLMDYLKDFDLVFHLQ